MPVIPPPCQRPAPVTAGDEPGPATLCTLTTMRTSAPTDIDLKPGQPHTVHRLSAAWSTDPGECGAATPLTAHRRALRAAINHRVARVADFLPAQAQPPRPVPATKQPPTASRLKLRLYQDDDP